MAILPLDPKAQVTFFSNKVLKLTARWRLEKLVNSTARWHIEKLVNFTARWL